MLVDVLNELCRLREVNADDLWDHYRLPAPANIRDR